MTLALLVAGKQTGTFGTFEVADGNVSKARKLILQFFNDTTALVPMDARSTFTTAEEHAAFDATLMGLSTVGVGIQYVESIGKFMDPKARFAEWLKGEAPIMPDLTPEEAAVPTAYESAKAKFVAMFTPAMPTFSVGGIDTVAIFGADDAAEIEKWRKNERETLPSSVTRKIAGGQAARGLLRVIPKGTGHIVQNDQGHHISRTNFFRGFASGLTAYWQRADRDPSIRAGRVYVDVVQSGYSRSTDKAAEVYNDYIEVGCQSIPRLEVERAHAELLNLGYTK